MIYEQEVNSESVIPMFMARGGGFAMEFREKQNVPYGNVCLGVERKMLIQSQLTKSLLRVFWSRDLVNYLYIRQLRSTKAI